MDKKKMFFIFNPNSGKGQIKNHLLEIVDIFTKGGYEITIYPTQEKDDALHKIQELADSYDLIVCSGGDGTLDEVITGVMRGDVHTPVGYIPAGTTNDFAHSLKIPKSMKQAAQNIVSGVPFACDVGVFNDDYFVYIAAFGVFTDVSYMTNQQMKNILGRVAYVLEGAKRLVDIPSYHIKVEIEGQIIRDEFVYGMVTNSKSVGGMKNMTGKHVELDDGKFEVTLIKMPKNLLQLSEIVANLARPKDADTPYIYTFKSDHVKLHCEEKVPWTLDGEFGGEHQDVEITNHCRRLTFMVEK